MKKFLILILFFLHALCMAQQPATEVGTVFTEGNVPVHDPVIIQQKNTYYLFSTGFGISVYSSTDLKQWRREKPVFSKPPQWAVDKIKGYRGHTWAPDISYIDGKYYLYYSVSAFGKNTSAIGLAVNATLDTSESNYGWTDMGEVIQSVPGRDMWNAIDPNLAVDESRNKWLSFGSFWEGLKLFKLNDDGTRPSEPQQWFAIAARERHFTEPDSSAGNAAIEAPFIFRNGEYYYLFASWDFCCRGEKSNYKIVIGRSKDITGPYLDKTGKDMAKGGGSLFLEGDGKKWYGLGHNGVAKLNGKDYIVYHGYDAADKGRSKLIIQQLFWDKEGWPTIK